MTEPRNISPWRTKAPGVEDSHIPDPTKAAEINPFRLFGSLDLLTERSPGVSDFRVKVQEDVEETPKFSAQTTAISSATDSASSSSEGSKKSESEQEQMLLHPSSTPEHPVTPATVEKDQTQTPGEILLTNLG